MPDPTRIFSGLVLTILFVRYLQAHEWNFGGAIGGLFLNPYVVFYVATAGAAVVLGLRAADAAIHQPWAHLPVYDRWTVEWYWWNAWLYHAVMDGSAGSLRLVPVVVHQYDVLDLRFPHRHVVPYLIGLVELLVMYPLCLATVYAILARSSYRFPLELLVSTLQVMGMIIFVGSEVYEGQVNIPALDPVGNGSKLSLKFNLYHLMYYWFGFWFCNLLWGVVPYYRIHRAVAECRRALQHSSKSNKQS